MVYRSVKHYTIPLKTEILWTNLGRVHLSPTFNDDGYTSLDHYLIPNLGFLVHGNSILVGIDTWSLQSQTFSVICIWLDSLGALPSKTRVTSLMYTTYLLRVSWPQSSWGNLVLRSGPRPYCTEKIILF